MKGNYDRNIISASQKLINIYKNYIENSLCKFINYAAMVQFLLALPTVNRNMNYV